MTRARSLSRLANSNVLTVDNTNQVGIGSTIPDAKLDVGGDLYADDLIIRNITGVAATFSGVVSYEDITNVDSVGIITAQSYVSIADSIVHTGDIDTSIRFPAADTFTVETAGIERARIDSDGRLVVGTNSAPAYTRMLLQGNNTDTGGGAVLRMCLGGTDPGTTEDLGTITFSDSGQVNAAYIKGRRDGGTWTSGSSQPTYLEFATAADGATFPTERVRITSTGRVGIGTDVPGGTLHVHGPTGDAGQIYVTDGDAAGTGNSFLISKGGTTTTIKDRQASSNIDFGTADTHAVRIDSSQRVIIGSSNNNVNNDALQVNTAGGSNLGVSRFSDNAGGPDLFLVKSRNSTPGSHTTVADGDVLGQIRFRGDDGTNYVEGCRLFAEVNGAVSTNTVTTDLVFGSGTTGTERLRISSGGNLLIGLTDAVGEGGTPADLNSTEVGRGYINLARDDTAAADHILFGKNGSIAASIGTDTTNTIVFKTGTTERLRITSGGQLIVSKLQSESVGGGENAIQSGGNISVLRRTNDANGPYINLGKSRNTSEGSFTIVQDGDIVGSVGFIGDDGTDINSPLAYINGVVDGTPSANSIPGALSFRTTASGTSTTERLIIDSRGSFHFKNGLMIENGLVSATARNGIQNVNLDTVGMVFYVTGASTGTWKPNFQMSTGNDINATMGTGDVISPTMIVAKGATTHYADTIQVDGVDVTPEWLGGAPTAGGGSGTFDVYSYTIIKTGDDAFKCFASVSTYE